MPRATKPQLPRKYETVYYRWRREVKSFKYSHLDNACAGAFKNVERNKYQATTVEVIDMDTSEIYLTIYIGVDGNIFSLYGPGAQDKLKLNRQLLKRLAKIPD